MPPHEPPPRARNAEATRAAILAAAIRAFAAAGYDGVGVREIATAAGVTAMMVNRYFGSKENLFAEAVDVSFAPPTVVAEDAGSRAELARGAAANLVDRTAADAQVLEPYLIMVRSVSNPRAAEIVREGIARHVGHRLAAQLPGPHEELRSEMMLAVIAGTILMRRVIATPALSAADSTRLTELLTAVFTATVQTPLA